MSKLRLGINIDHVATLRNARGGEHPCPVRAALLAMEAGADGITAHLREDRRHIRDHDIARLKAEVNLPLNFEMAATDEMLAIALKTAPHAVCLVPEKRHELTTEGGLNVSAQLDTLTPYIAKLQDNGSRVSLFIDPDRMQVDAARQSGSRAIEFHTGAYAHGDYDALRIAEMAAYAHGLGLEVHAGHGLNYANVGPIAAITQIVELNIGHFLMGEAMFTGLKPAIATMRQYMEKAR